jgi:hypothetical protein
MTTAPGVAVVATQLAHTDRRALSQAWYSALHLAAEAPALRATRGAAPAAARAAEPAHVRASVEAPRAPRPNSPPARAPRARDGMPPLAERRSVPGDAARRLERAVARIGRRPRPGPPHTVAIDGGRVTLLVRADSDVVRIVALCHAPLRATVERALAHARFTLAARGTTVRTPC